MLDGALWLEVSLTIELAGLNEGFARRILARQQETICRNQIVVFQLDDISNFELVGAHRLKFSFASLADEAFHGLRVHLLVLLVSLVVSDSFFDHTEEDYIRERNDGSQWVIRTDRWNTLKDCVHSVEAVGNLRELEEEGHW